MASRIGTALTCGLFASLALAGVGRGGHAADHSATASAAADDPQYQACLASAGAVRDAAQAAECKRLAEQAESDRANCLKLNLSKNYCDASYAPRDSTAACKLPDEVASVLDAALSRARFRCARMLKAREGKL